ncbi:hypothetical protein ACFU8Q_40110 [Streptomyces sp. NPDC057543]
MSGIVRGSRWKDTEPDEPAHLVPTLAAMMLMVTVVGLLVAVTRS